MTERDLLDLSAEIDGLSAILEIISVPFLEHDGQPGENITGEALHGAAQYARRISQDVLSIHYKSGGGLAKA